MLPLFSSPFSAVLCSVCAGLSSLASGAVSLWAPAVCASHVAFDACALLLEPGALDTLYRNETICNLCWLVRRKLALQVGYLSFSLFERGLVLNL